ncbi:MAG: hypothetical protein AAF401_12985 [Pseudomonadota bacterium]
MSFLDEFKPLLATVAPTLATAVGGPLAGIAVRTVAGAILGDDSASEGDVAAALRAAGPEDLVKLRKIDAEFKARIEEAGVKLEETAAKDRDSARRRQVAMNDWTPTVLGVLILLGFFGVLAAIMYVDLPDGSGPIVNILLGALAAMCTQVGNYFFGSSAGSKRKNEMIQQLKATAS